MLTLLLIPLVVVVERLWRNEQWWLLAIVLAMQIASGIPGLLYRRLEIPIWLSLLPFTFLLLLWGLLAWMIVTERRSSGGLAVGAEVG
jgi:hypothetical protein